MITKYRAVLKTNNSKNSYWNKKSNKKSGKYNNFF